MAIAKIVFMPASCYWSENRPPFCGKDCIQNGPASSSWISYQPCWVPGNSVIRGNEWADWVAKKALNSNVETCLIPHSDLKPLILIATHIKCKWQHEWDEINKLHEIELSVGKPPQIHAGGQRDEVVLSHCCIGQSRLTHAFLLKCLSHLTRSEQQMEVGWYPLKTGNIR